MAGNFYIIKCQKCNQFFIQENRRKINKIIANCKNCSHTFSLFTRSKNYAGQTTIFYGPYDVRTANQVIIEMKKQIATNNGQVFVAELSEFETYGITNSN